MPDNNGKMAYSQVFDFGNLLKSIQPALVSGAKSRKRDFAFVTAALANFTPKDLLQIFKDPQNKGLSIILKKVLPICDEEIEDIDFCAPNSVSQNLVNPIKRYQIPIDDSYFKKFSTGYIKIDENSWREFISETGSGSIAGAIESLIDARFFQVFGKIDTWIGQSLYDKRGCYPDGVNTPRSISLIRQSQDGQNTLNSQAFDEIAESEMKDDNPAPKKVTIGGTNGALARMILARTVPNTSIGIDQSIGVLDNLRNMYTSQKINKIGDGAEKIIEIDPRYVDFITYIDEGVWTGGINSILPRGFGGEAQYDDWLSYITSGKLLLEENGTTVSKSFVYIDPFFGLRWKGELKLDQCGGKFDLLVKFHIKAALLFSDKGDFSCTNRCATGVTTYNVCVPEPQPSCAPTTMPVLPPSLCAYVTMPTPCNYQIAKGDTLSLDFGGMTYEYVMPYTLVLEDTDAVLANIQSMFTQYTEKGRFVQDGGTKQWLYIEPFQSGTTSNALTVGAGKVSASCFAADIDFELRNCDAAVTRKIETRGVEQPTKADPASFINTALAKSTVTATKTTVTSTKANPSK